MFGSFAVLLSVKCLAGRHFGKSFAICLSLNVVVVVVVNVVAASSNSVLKSFIFPSFKAYGYQNK